MEFASEIGAPIRVNNKNLISVLKVYKDGVLKAKRPALVICPILLTRHL